MSEAKISEAAPVAYMTNESNTGSAKIMARVVTVGDFGGDERAMHEMARAFGWKPLYLHQQPEELADQQGDSVDELIESWTRQAKERFEKNEFSVVAESLIICARELKAAIAATGKQQVGEDVDREQLGDLVEGVAVSVDVDGLFSTERRRLFGTITAVQHEDGEKGGLILLVQESEPN